MLAAIFSQIKELTSQAAETVSNENIVECNNILIQRQKLLVTLLEQVSALPDDEETKNEFFELLKWIKDKDNIALLVAKKLKLAQQQKIVGQTKAASAIKQYKSIS